MIFDVYGPFELHRPHGDIRIIQETLTRLIAEAEEAKEGLSTAPGCYVFGIRASGGIVPWYVGQTNSELVKEALNPANREKYTTEIRKKRKGTPVLFLLPRLTPTGRFGRPTAKSSESDPVRFLEKWLIASALQKNPEMINDKNTFFCRNVHVTGIFNPTHGGATAASRKLKKTLGLK